MRFLDERLVRQKALRYGCDSFSRTPSFFRYIEGTYILYIYKLLYTTYRLKLAKNGVPPSKKTVTTVTVTFLSKMRAKTH